MANTAKLSAIPKGGHELEEYVSALFHASRYFVERNVTERDFTEILELDAVATSYEADAPHSVLAEAKSGGWGFSDIFKVVGWMCYLDLPRGAFFVSKENPAMAAAAIQPKIAPLNVAFVDLGDFTQATQRFEVAGFNKVRDPLLVGVWRYSAWAERLLIDRLRATAKANPGQAGPRAALEYHRLVNDGIFFVKDLIDRALQLYDAYQKHPKLSLGVAIEMGGGEYDPDPFDPQNPVMRQAILKGEHGLLQACFYVEHRARLSILKTAIDIANLEGTGGRIPLTLPGTFRSGIEKLESEPFFKRYALFWQYSCGATVASS